MDEKLNLSLEVKDINNTLNALGQMPYVQVVDLIGNIKSQAESQLQRKQQQAESVEQKPQFLQESA